MICRFAQRLLYFILWIYRRRSRTGQISRNNTGSKRCRLSTSETLWVRLPARKSTNRCYSFAFFLVGIFLKNICSGWHWCNSVKQCTQKQKQSLVVISQRINLQILKPTNHSKQNNYFFQPQITRTKNL